MKNWHQRLAIIVTTCCVSVIMATNFAMAGTVNPLVNLEETGVASYGVTRGQPPQPLPVIIGSVIKQAFAFTGIVMVVLILYGGFLWMTAMGQNEQIDKAKKIITNAVVGLIIMLAAYSITHFVVASIVNGTVGTGATTKTS